MHGACKHTGVCAACGKGSPGKSGEACAGYRAAGACSRVGQQARSRRALCRRGLGPGLCYRGLGRNGEPENSMRLWKRRQPNAPLYLMIQKLNPMFVRSYSSKRSC